MVVLPAPLGRGSPAPRRRPRSATSPSTAVTAPYRFSQVAHLDRGVVHSRVSRRSVGGPPDTLAGVRRCVPAADISNTTVWKFSRRPSTRRRGSGWPACSWSTARPPPPRWPSGSGSAPTAVRRHLDALVADGLATEPRAAPASTAPAGAAGRRRVSLLTEAGRDLPPRLRRPGRRALRFLAETGGRRGGGRVRRPPGAELEERYRAGVEAGRTGAGPRRSPRP